MMSRYSIEALVAAGLSVPDIARFAPRRANARIFNAVGKLLGIEDERIVKPSPTTATRPQRRSPFRSRLRTALNRFGRARNCCWRRREQA